MSPMVRGFESHPSHQNKLILNLFYDLRKELGYIIIRIILLFGIILKKSYLKRVLMNSVTLRESPKNEVARNIYFSPL